MAIQVPRLERIPVQQEASIGRTEAKAPNVIGAMQTQSDAVEKLGGNIADHFYKQEVHAADSVSQNEVNGFERDVDEELSGPNGAKYQEGNPAEVYQKLEQNVKTKQDAIREKYKDASPLVKQAIEDKLEKAMMRFTDKKISYQGAQTERWETGITNDRVSLAKDNMVEGSIFIAKGDDASLSGIQNARNEITDAWEARGLKNGTVTKVKDADGKLISHNISVGIQRQIDKDLSESMGSTIETLSRSGKTEEAQWLIEKYGDDLKGKQKEHLLGVTQKNMTEQKGIQAAYDVKDRDPSTQYAILNKITDPEVRKHALAEAESNQRIRENQIQRQQNDNYEAMMKDVRTGKFQTVAELRKDPKFAAMADNKRLDQKHIDAIENVIENPKISNLEAESNLYDIAMSPNGFRGMSKDQFDLMAAGVKKEDRRKFETRLMADNNQSQGEKARADKKLMTTVEQQLINSGYLKKNGNEPYSKAMLKKRKEALDELTLAYDTFPMQNPSDADVVKYANKFASDKVAKVTFSPPEQQKPKFASVARKTNLPDSNYPNARPTEKQQEPMNYKVAKKKVMRDWKNSNPNKDYSAVSSKEWDQMTEKYLKENGK